MVYEKTLFNFFQSLSILAFLVFLKESGLTQEPDKLQKVKTDSESAGKYSSETLSK
jgi:hypothetical protein